MAPSWELVPCPPAGWVDSFTGWAPGLRWCSQILPSLLVTMAPERSPALTYAWRIPSHVPSASTKTCFTFPTMLRVNFFCTLQGTSAFVTASPLPFLYPLFISVSYFTIKREYHPVSQKKNKNVCLITVAFYLVHTEPNYLM